VREICLLFCSLLAPMLVPAPEDLLGQLEAEANALPVPVVATFKSTQIIEVRATCELVPYVRK